MKRRWQSVLMISALFLLLLTGCQPVDGLDLNNVLINSSTKVQSAEGYETLTVDFFYDETFASERARKILDLFDGANLEVHTVTKDVTTASMDGKLSLKAGDIPFEMTVEGNPPKVAIHLPNDFSKPFLLESGEPSALTPVELEKSQQLQETILSYIVPHLPNPETISVKKATENIHNETVAGTQIHAEIYGKEIQKLVTVFLENILKDSEGLAKLLNEMAKLAGEEGISGEEMNELKLTEEELKSILEEIQASTGPYLSSLDQNTFLKVDRFFDSDLFPRRQAYEIGFALPGGRFGFKLQGLSEVWNINKNPEIQRIESDQYLTEASTEEEVLNALNKEGTLYHILKEELKVFKKEILLTVGQTQAVSNGKMVELEAAPFIKQNYTMVPLRFVSENLGAEVEWDDDLHEIVVRDDGKEIVLKPGSSSAYVNGSEVVLPAPVEVKNGRSFVPLRFISETLGFEVEWNPELQMITLSKDSE